MAKTEIDETTRKLLTLSVKMGILQTLKFINETEHSHKNLATAQAFLNVDAIIAKAMKSIVGEK